MKNKYCTYLCYAIMGLYAVSITIISPLLTYISNSFSVTITQAGLIFSTNFLGFVIFIFVGGALADICGKKKILLIALIGFSFALLALPLSPNFFILCVISGFVGGFGGIMESLVSSIIFEINPKNSTFHVNAAQVFFGLGALIGPVGAGIIVASGANWRLCYYITVAISLTTAFLFSKVSLPMSSKSSTVNLGELKRIFGDKKLMLICLCMAFYTGSEVGGWGWMSTFLKQGLMFSIIKSSVAVGVFWIAMSIGRIFCGRLILKYKTRNIMIILGFSSSIVTALSGLVSFEIAAWIIIILMGITYSSQWPLILDYGGKQSKTSSGMVFSVLVGFGGIGSTTVPYLMGLTSQFTNIHFAMASPAVLLLLVGLIFLFMKKT